MKAYTSRERFDEQRRFTGVFHQMGRAHLDSDHNEGVRVAAQDRVRRSGDLAEGSPDDGFLISPLHLVEPIRSSQDFVIRGADPADTRVVPLESGLTRRELESLPYVYRARGIVALSRTFDAPLDVDHLPIPTDPTEATYAAQALVLRLKVAREITDDDAVDPHLVLVDAMGTERRMTVVFGELPPTGSLRNLGEDWQLVRIPRSSWAGMPTEADGSLRIRGWGLRGLALRSEVFVGELLADPELPETDFVIRGGDGTLRRAGRIYAQGLRSFIESDWRYTLQPDLPLPTPIVAGTHRYLAVLDLWEREVTAVEDDFLVETALDGDDTTWRRRLVSQVRLLRFEAADVERLPAESGAVRLTTNVPEGVFPDRFPSEEVDACRDACLYTENQSTGQGYRGTENIHVRVELLTVAGRTAALWSRNNAATVAPLAFDASIDASSVVVDAANVLRFRAGDIVVVEDRHSRLDPSGPRPAILRQLRSVNAATGQLEFHGATHTLTRDPVPLPAGGALGRAFTVADQAAVRRWDGADWRLDGIRYNLQDGITFRFSGGDDRSGEYWSFTARVENPDGGSLGVVEALDEAPVSGPRHVLALLARLSFVDGERLVEDLRDRFLPLKDVRDRLIELGRRKISPGAFTVVVGDGVRTYGDIDQELTEGVTGDEAIQHAVDRVRAEGGGTVYIRAGTYALEHPVLLDGISGVHILGDGDASFLRVTGAGGAFYLDDCGANGQVEIELLRIEEDPDAEIDFGEPPVVIPGPGPVLPGPPLPFLVPTDLVASLPSLPNLAHELGVSLKTPADPARRVSASVVATLERLRAIQRQNPGQPLEDVAADELEVLRGLPHGVITVSDSVDIRLRRLDLATVEAPSGGGLVAAGILVTGTCANLVIEDNRITAPYGVVAAAYSQFLGPGVLSQRPIASLRLTGVRIAANRLVADGVAELGVRIADGLVDGVEIVGNRILGFPVGIGLEDQAEVRTGAAADRTRVADNQIVGSTRIGVRVRGDGVDVVGNEVRPLASAEPVQVGVQVVGVGIRVRDCWIELPGGAGPELALTAGILVGDGVDGPLARPVGDVEIADNRIEAGLGSRAVGVLIGGSQPVLDVRIRGNVLRGLGDAGIRAWGHGGPIGALRIEQNRVEDVARVMFGWSDAVRDELSALALVGGITTLATANTPAQALQRLLAHPNDASLPAIDALLRWLERATLRGGVVLSQVEQATLTGNQILRVGVTALPAGFRSPGAEVRTAGIAAVGGVSIAVRDNRVERVQGAQQIVVAPGGIDLPIGELPIVDHLRALGLASTVVSVPGRDLYGSLVSMRRMVTGFTGASSAARGALEGRMYTPLGALVEALQQLGGPGRPLAEALAASTAALREGSGRDTQTKRAHELRAVLSDAAAAAATDPLTTQTWRTAARLDRAMTADPKVLVEEVAEARKVAATLTRGMERLELGLDDVLAKVEASPDGVRLHAELAATMDQVGQARTELAETERGLVGADLGPSARALVGHLTTSLVDGVDELAGGQPIDGGLLTELSGLTQSLMKTVSALNTKLAADLGADFAQLVDVHGKLDPEAAARLKGTLGRIRELARDGGATGVGPAELERLVSIYDEQLVGLTAAALEAAVRDASVGGSSRAVERLVRDAEQLEALIGKDQELAPIAATVVTELRAASDAATASASFGRAREALVNLQSAIVQHPIPQDPKDPPTRTDETPRLAALGQEILDLRDVGEVARNADGLPLFTSHLANLLDLAGAGAFVRSTALARVEAASQVLGSSIAGEAAAAAWFALADELDRVTVSLVLGSRGGSAAVVALSGVVRRALDPAMVPASRLTSIASFLATRRQALSGSLTDKILAARDVETVLSTVRRGLSQITGVTSGDLGLVPVPVEGLAYPADALFASGVQQGLDLVGNELVSAQTGVFVRDPTGHVLADPDDALGVVVTAERNRVVGCVAAGLDLRPGVAVQVVVSQNHLLGCMGLARSGQTAFGAGTLTLVGGGELSLFGNVLHDNGDPVRAGILHEVLIDWRGDLGVGDNRIRHLGGRDGGAGLLVLAEVLDPALVQRLVTTPALEVEPAPSTTATQQRSAGGVFTHSSELFELGALRATARTAQPTYRVLSQGVATATSSTVASSFAELWTTASTNTATATAIHPLLDFVQHLPVPIWFPVPPKARRALAVQGNDVVSTGPALQILANGGALVSVNVVGNQLESAGTMGAVYLRQVDTTVFANNRCESVDQVNVAVIRAGEALVSVTGNTLAGEEPPAPPPKPTPAVAAGRRGDTTLNVSLGEGLSFTRALDGAVLSQLLSERRNPDLRAATSSPLIEQILVDALATEDNPQNDPTPHDPQSPQVPQTPQVPNTRLFSLVIIGGARVAALGNATTAGVHVHDPGQSVENNV